MSERANILVIGAGPAGIAAATRAAESGARVMLVDEGLAPGGQIWRRRPGVAPRGAAAKWLDRLARSGATVVSGASAADLRRLDDDAWLLVVEQAGTAFAVAATRVVLATGARERFLPLPGWTLPGVVGVGGAQALLKSGASFAGKRVVIAGSGPLLLPVAASLASSGARVVLVAEQAPSGRVLSFAAGLWRRPGTLLQAARYRAAFARTRYVTAAWVTRANGEERLRSVTVSLGGRTRTLDCDLLCTGFGLVPNTELARLAGCRIERGVVIADDLQLISGTTVHGAGEILGIGGVDCAVVEGEIAGLAAAGRVGEARALFGRRRAARAAARVLEQTFAVRDELRSLASPDTVVCRCEDVPLSAFTPSWSARQAKLYTRAGMGACQGRVCGVSLGELFGWEADTVRMPAEPLRVSTLLADADPTTVPPEHGVS